MYKCTKKLYTEEATKFKHNADLEFFCKMVKKYLQKHGLDTITYCEDPTSSGDMISLFTDYPKFWVEEVKKQNQNLYNGRYDKQNNKEGIKCLLSSPNKELCKNKMARIEDNMKFSKFFMVFIKHEQPQHRELYDAIEQQLLNIDIGKFPGTNIKEMCVKT